MLGNTNNRKKKMKLKRKITGKIIKTAFHNIKINWKLKHTTKKELIKENRIKTDCKL